MTGSTNVQSPALRLMALNAAVKKELGGSDIKLEGVRLIDQTLMSIRSAHNGRVPINRLPPELLAKIFAHVSAPGHRTSMIVDSVALVVVTHVCRLWRAVALESAALWSHISLHQKCAPVFFQRSQAVPLTVWVRGKRGERRQMDLLRRHLPRIHAMHVKVKDIQDLPKLKDILSSPGVVYLTLQVTFFLPTPEVYGVLCHSTLRYSLALTSLHLITGHPYTARHLLSILADTPSLEFLEVHQVQSLLPWLSFSKAGEHRTATVAPIRLMCLREMTIMMGEALAVYSALSVPEDAKVILVGCLPPGPQYLEPNPQLQAFPEVEILFNHSDAVLHVRHGNCSIQLHARLSCFSSGDRRIWEYARYLSKAHTISFTTASRIYPTENSTLPDLLSLLNHAPRLAHLHIRDVYGTVVPVLAQVLARGTDSEARVCPALTTLTLSLASPACYVDTTGLAPLFRATEARARRGAPLQSVTVCSPRHHMLNPTNVLSNGAHGLEWLLICDRDLCPAHVSDPYDKSPDGESHRTFRRRWEERECDEC
ncbi:hypothetical protein C8Q80DRAFT_1270014 [Daedaleopsis nitida]|nr:hypothetical protein C8Q80DRAFT_1270014 [Daedaleopsis nitida]